MKSLKIIITSSLAVMLASGACLAANEKSKPEDERARELEKAIFIAAGSQNRVLKIGLLDCMLYALKNNSEIQIQAIEPRIKKADERIAEAGFEPEFSADFSIVDNTEIAANSLQGADKFNSQDTNLNAGVSGKLPAGTEYSLDLLNQRYKSDSKYQIFNPYYLTEPQITITQPLLRGFGMLVNKADILIARNNTLVSRHTFKNTVMDTISKAKSAYFNYVYYLGKFSIADLSLKRANDLLETNRQRYKKGLLSSVELLETEAAAAEREKALLTAEADYKKAEDDLKLVTNLVNDPEVWNAKIELIDKPEFVQQDVDLLKSLQEAFAYRADYESAKIDLKSRDIKIKVAKNELFPTVDLIGSFGLNGLGDSYQNALKKINTEYPEWSAGVKLTIPWGGQERAKFDQRGLEKAQALLSFKRLEQNIILEVRDKVRLSKMQYRQVNVAKLSKDKETQNYQAQQERYAAGQVSTHDILDYQDKLSQAELDYIKALVDYNIALINLDKSTGLTLVKNDIKLEEPKK